MKKCLLIVTALLYISFLNAQTHRATAVPAKKIAGFVKNKNFVTQGISAACDTLKLDSARNLWSAFYYSNGTDGYVLGVSDNTGSGFNVQEDANYYDVSGSGYNYITGGVADFAFANSNTMANLNKNLIFKVYDDAGGYPGTVLGSVNEKLSDIKASVDDSKLFEFKFSTPIAIPSGKIFYISVDHSNFLWNASTKDSIAIIADSTDQAPAAAYQFIALSTGQDTQTQWFKTSDIWDVDNMGDHLDVNLFLFPYVSNSLNGCATLPVSILNFKGNIKNNDAYLTWNTATEFNNKGFEIERSSDGKQFTDLGFVKGAGTSSRLNTYSYTDATLNDLSNISYYRLKQIDFDGKTSYSNIITLGLNNTANWRIYPNPIKDKLNIELNLSTAAKVSVQVISKDGKLLLNADKGILQEGHQQLSFNINNLASGSYYVRVKAGNDAYTKAIIKQ